MTMIQTLRGPVALDVLGETMMHEHVFFANWGDESKRARSIAYARDELGKLAACGARTLVDVGPSPMRNMAWYAELAPQVPLQIILSTGFYVEGATPSELRQWDEDRYIERFTRELSEGIAGSTIRGSLIKVAANKAQLTPWESKVFRAAARAQRETGVPICTHACEGARSQFDLLTSAGADPERIYLSHVEAEFGWEGRTLRDEARYLEAIAREGGSFFFNNFQFEFDTPHEDLMYLMHTLCDRGHASRVLLGMDANFQVDDEGQVWLEAQREHPETAVRTYAYTYTGAMPLMRRWGFTDEHFRIFLVDNPRRMFGATRI
jgi:phosphotriesterase-related protein